MRKRPLIVAAVGGAIACVASSFLPWLKSGTVVRSGFGLARDAWGAGLTDVRLGTGLLVAWFLSPIAAAGAWTAASLRRNTTAGILAGMAGGVSVAAGAAVLASGTKTLLGPYAAILAGALGIAGGAGLILTRKRADD